MHAFVSWHSHFTGNILHHCTGKWHNTVPKYQETNTARQTSTWAYKVKAITHGMTDNLSKRAYVSFVWELKQKDSWGISDSNLFLRQYASTTCMSQIIMYSLLSAQNVWINSCECFGLHEVQESTCTSSMHIFVVIESQMRIMSFTIIRQWSNQVSKHMNTEIFSIYDCLFLIFHFISLCIAVPSDLLWDHVVLCCTAISIVFIIVGYILSSYFPWLVSLAITAD